MVKFLFYFRHVIYVKNMAVKAKRLLELVCNVIKLVAGKHFMSHGKFMPK
jgi:hypothetical protein